MMTNDDSYTVNENKASYCSHNSYNLSWLYGYTNLTEGKSLNIEVSLKWKFEFESTNSTVTYSGRCET